MRITIEVPDELLSRTAPTAPSITTDLGTGAAGDVMSGGEAAAETGGVALSQNGIASAGVAEQGGEATAIAADDGTNDGGAAPKSK
jgi:hypothetical protein